MAEALAKQWIKECHPRALSIKVTSMALSDEYEPPGSPASAHAVTAMRRRGLDLTSHRSQLVNDALIAQADIIVCVTAKHEQLLRERYPTTDVPIHVFLQDIPDPWHQSAAEYEACAMQLHEGIGTLLPLLNF
ncbi:hypothetical protein DYB25_012124 [Aphanomyces astaci]|uniref:Phosphotyrosine protein phosphatase I domain-containing protein n=1 Tax=Aphanomyces astaci TaxID=112090 RepID=A0A397A7I6_APHAT|nr:hypothetical protein DYB25_012124 [Aphanomyces astaci]